MKQPSCNQPKVVPEPEFSAPRGKEWRCGVSCWHYGGILDVNEHSSTSRYMEFESSPVLSLCAFPILSTLPTYVNNINTVHARIRT